MVSCVIIKVMFKLIPCLPSGRYVGRRMAEDPFYACTTEGERLRAIRRAQGLSIGKAAQLVGLKALQFSGLERGKYTLSYKQWEQVFLGLRPQVAD